MGFNRKSDFIIGDDSSYNLSSFLECLQKTYAGVGIYDLMNFSNTGIPGIKAGAVVDVQGTLYVLDADTQAVYRDSGGTVSALSGAPDGDYYLALIDAGETVTIAALLISATTIARSAAYAGYYETGTTNRILGGFTKAGTSYSAKWRYLYQTHEDAKAKIASDGITADIFKLTSFCNNDVVENESIDTSISTVGVFDVGDITLNYPVTISKLKVSGFGYPAGSGTYSTVRISFVRVIDGEECGVSSASVIMNGTETDKSYAASFQLFPGYYKIKVTASAAIYNPGGGNVTAAPTVSNIKYSVLGVIGNNDGTY